MCWDMVDFERKTITIERALNLQYSRLQDEPKTSNSRRTITLDSEIINMLAALKERQRQQNKNKKVIVLKPGLMRWRQGYVLFTSFCGSKKNVPLPQVAS